MRNNRLATRPSRRLKASFFFVLFVLFVGSSYTASCAREITDMAGRKVVVPDRITKVCGDWPIVMYLIYAIDPTLLAGISAPFTTEQKKYLSPEVEKLPVVGGFFGQSATITMEALLKAKPDVVVAEMWGNMELNVPSEKLLAKLGIPVAYVKIDKTSDYPAAFLFLGNLLGREKRARTLADYGDRVLKETARTRDLIPQVERPRVYYAEGMSGLFTECDTSIHAELISLSGATNVHRCSDGRFKVRGREPVSLEQVLRYDPEVIIATEPAFYGNVFKDERWQNVRAVKTGRVYLSPTMLLNWFDRPPSFMRLLGIKWLMWRLYPERHHTDIIGEACKFYRLFLGINVPEETMKRALFP
ncbi:MAG TPA: ABC transporter substrate-binding protein [Syntrophorhabdaceae bacterium]|nr:ABC transporter substrate-binding protein [Syntrophorhabdaceae bacterium]